jgi:hypothetical protein
MQKLIDNAVMFVLIAIGATAVAFLILNFVVKPLAGH